MDRLEFSRSPSSINVLGVRIDAVGISDVVTTMTRWIEQERDRCHIIVNTGMHGIMEARRDPQFRKILNCADLFFPDGISLLLIARGHGIRVAKRNTGPELLSAFCALAQEKGFSNFFYGDTPETLDALGKNLQRKYPRLKISGKYSPPFRALRDEEDSAVVEMINNSGSDVLWVGLGCPKQERWMFEHRDKLNVPIIIGVGAYFKFHGGTIERAPPIVANHGFEWAYRLMKEPRRVWRRYLLDGPRFVIHGILELVGLREYH
jgi:N-acetylglucosaminyldiphosphoundecaprenol N-acetyl-beta-D-mannosaminyltransferase